jgi:hypothetical protein
MIEYSSPNTSSNYFIDFLTIQAGQISNGVNNISFNTGTFYNRCNAGFNCVPIQFIIYNNLKSSPIDLNQFSMTNGTDKWNSTADVTNNRYTILFPLDKTKGNHQHIDDINLPLEASFTAPATASLGSITITVLFSSWL